MKKITVSLIGMLFCGVSYGQEFDFNGAVLGMKLSEFQALPPINGKLSPDGKAGWCEQNTKPLVCHRVGDDPFGRTDTAPAYGSYYFDKDKNGEIRLYMVMLMANRSNYPIAELGLTQKWGAGKSSSSTATNGLGQEIKTISLAWDKPNSSISLEAPCGNVKYLCLTYTHKVLSRESASHKKQSGGGF